MRVWIVRSSRTMTIGKYLTAGVNNSDSFSEKAFTGKKLMADEKSVAINRKKLFLKNSPQLWTDYSATWNVFIFVILFCNKFRMTIAKWLD
jgi:hypothetical protein